MEAFLLIARLILAALFGVAGIAKWFDRAGSEKAIVNFGVPKNWARPLAVVLPMVEIATAILLLPLATAWLGAVLALVLLLAFVGGIIYIMAQGKAPDCHCFGQIHSEPVGWSVLIRNLILTAIAACLVYAARETAGTSALAWLEDLSSGERMQLFFNLAFVALLVAIFVGLRKVLQNQIVLQRQIEVLELAANETGEKREVERKDVAAPSVGLPVGAVAPNFAASDFNNRQITLEHLLMRGKPILMFFVSPTCQPCRALLPKIEEWQRDFDNNLTVVFVSSGTILENKEKFNSSNNTTVLLQNDREIARSFRSAWTPGAILINDDGTIGSALATGDREIYGLIDDLKKVLLVPTGANGNYVADKLLILPKKKRESLAPRAGQPVPQFALPSLDGRQISSKGFRGTKTLLLFWRATCPYCQSMTEDLKRWEAQPGRTFDLVVVAMKEPEIERAREFKSTVLIESDLEVQRLFEHDGTPGGLIIDENGRIASDIASGADDVFALVGYYQSKTFSKV